MNQAGQIQTGLRVSESLDDTIAKIANECDMSKNSTIKMLIGLGIKAYENVISRVEWDPIPPRTSE